MILVAGVLQYLNVYCIARVKNREIHFDEADQFRRETRISSIANLAERHLIIKYDIQ